MLEEQLANVLQQQVGLNAEQARSAAHAALQFIKEQVPQAAPLLDMAGGINLGGLLGGSGS